MRAGPTWSSLGVGIALIAAGTAAHASSFPELRRLAAALPADAWFFDARMELGYARPYAVEGLNAGWVAWRGPRWSGLEAVSSLELLRAPMVRDQRWGVGLQWRGSAARVGVLALGRRLDIASRPTWAQRTLRGTLSWREGRWTLGTQFDCLPGSRTLLAPRLLCAVADAPWRLAVLRRASAYREAPIWEGGFELRPAPGTTLALRFGWDSADLSVGARRGGISLRLSTALDGARAGGLSFVVTRP